MATKEELRAKYGVLYDILDVTKTESRKSIFYTYKEKEAIGKKIFKELYSKFQGDKRKGKTGFYMDDGKQIGILSQCQSLQALMLLASSFGLEFDDKHIIHKEQENLSIRQVMDMVIEDVLDRIGGLDETASEYVFDASPYETELFTVKYSNIEAITWVIPSFLLTLKYHADQGETCMWEKRLVKVISYGLDYLNKSFISNKREGTSDHLTIGWNFTKDCEEPSLYYTYTVCECFEAFSSIFTEYLTYKRAERDAKDNIPMDQELVDKYNEEMAAFERSKALSAKKDPSDLKAPHNPYNEIRLRYCEINNDSGEITGTPYGELEKKCMRVAREIWRLTQGEFADAFYYNDLQKKLSKEEIEMATTSDALFNTVYIINILLDAGFDRELRKRSVLASQREDDKGVAIAEREYNNLLESCQMAVQKAFRTYESLQKNGKEYIVDQFLVGFNERFETHSELIKDLRKRRMRVFSLLPLLIRTNNVISEYLIQYPQINMRKYLGYILENRYTEVEKSEKGDKLNVRWIWEKDGYFSCSNYYYVLALGEFYSYFERFESKFIPFYTANETHEKQIAAQREKELRANTGELGKLTLEIEDYQQQIQALQDELASVKTPVEDAVKELLQEELRKCFPELLCGFLREAARGLTAPQIDDAETKDSHKALLAAFGELMIAGLSGKIYEAVCSDSWTAAENAQAYDDLKRSVVNDFSEQLRNYVTVIKNSPYSTSGLFDSNKGV